MHKSPVADIDAYMGNLGRIYTKEQHIPRPQFGKRNAMRAPQ